MKAWIWTKASLLWIGYFLLTLKERDMYEHAQKSGRRVVGATHALWTTYKLRRNEPPQRRSFLTWAEFRKIHIDAADDSGR